GRNFSSTPSCSTTSTSPSQKRACGSSSPPRRYPFLWLSTESGGLPWQERNTRTGQMEGHRIVLDSTTSREICAPGGRNDQRSRLILCVRGPWNSRKRSTGRGLGRLSLKIANRLQRYGTAHRRRETATLCRSSRYAGRSGIARSNSAL